MLQRANPLRQVIAGTPPFREPRPITYSIADRISLLTHSGKLSILTPKEAFLSFLVRLSQDGKT